MASSSPGSTPIVRGFFRTTWVAVFLGGVGRLLSWRIIGAPPLPYIGFLLLEILGAPLFIYWQSRVAQSALAP